MRPDYIIIEGFMIFADRQEIDLSVFEPNSIIGILGENLDSAGGYDSNASGKSSLINAISWVFFDRIAIQSEGKLTKDEVINDFCKKAMVEFGFHDEKTNDQYVIVNEKTKTKSNFNLWINNELYVTNTPTLKRAKLYSILGFGGKSKADFKDFLNSFYFTGESTKSFASKTFSDQDRFDLVSRFRKLDIYDLAEKKVIEDRKECKNEIESLEYKLKSIDSLIDKTFSLENVDKEIQNIKWNIEEIKTSLEEMNKSLKLNQRYQELNLKLTEETGKLNIVAKQIENFIDSVNKVAQTLNVNNKEIISLTNEITKYPDEPLSELDIEIQKIEDFISKELLINRDLENKINLQKNIIEEHKEKDHLVCPQCQAKLLMSAGKLIKYTKISADDLIKIANQEIGKLNIESEKSRIRLEDYKDRRGQLRNKRDAINSRNIIKSNLTTTKSYKETENKKLLDEYKDYLFLNKGVYEILKDCLDLLQYEDYVNQQKVIDEIQVELNSLKFTEFNQEQYQKLNEEFNSLNLNITKLEEYKKQQLKFIAQKEEIDSQINDLKEDLEKYSFWVINFEKLKGIELLETEPLLEIVANRILEKMGTNINISYHVNLENKGIGLTLIEDSGIERNLELFSQGQANRISIASGLALKELASTNINFGLSLWDEVLEGLDNTGIEMFFNVLNDILGMKFVISHNNDLKNYFQNKILVTRKNNKSNIEIINSR